MTRVLLTVDAVGGVWRYGVELARALADRGVESVLALLGPPPRSAQVAEVSAIPSVRLIDTGLPLDWLSDGAAPVRAAGAQLARLARDLRVDLVQLNMPTLAAARFDVPTVAVTHGCVATWWDAARPGQPLDPQFEWHRRLMREGLHAADAVVAPTAAYARTVSNCYRLPRQPAVVHNGRTPLPDRARGTPHDCVLTVGRLWDPVKGADLLDRVAARLAVPFYAAGAVTGPHGEHARTEHLHLLGTLDEPALAARLAARPVFVSAAMFEPFGLAVLEAAMAGCALVLSDIAPFRELWRNAALFVAPDDARGFADAIDTLIGDAGERARLGAAAAMRALRYTPGAMAEGMSAVYARVPDRSAPHGRAA